MKKVIIIIIIDIRRNVIEDVLYKNWIRICSCDISMVDFFVIIKEMSCFLIILDSGISTIGLMVIFILRIDIIVKIIIVIRRFIM